MTLIEYVSALTNFTFDENQIKVIISRRGKEWSINEYTKPDSLTDRQSELLRADCLMLAYSSPTQKGSVSESDNDWKQSFGGDMLTNRKHLIDLAMEIYKRFNDPRYMSKGFRWSKL